MQNIVIVGGGVSGLLAAKMVARNNANAKVSLVEQSDRLGGLYTSFNTDGHGWLDYGMHMFVTCCDPEIDRYLEDVLPEDQWHRRSDNEKDIAGIYWHGALQKHSPFPDLRRLPAEELASMREGLMGVVQNDPAKDYSNAKNYLRSHFGSEVASKVMTPLLEKLCGMPADQLDYFATRLGNISRVVLCDEEEALRGSLESASFRSRIAYPDQMKMPEEFRTNNKSQATLYPRRFGLVHFIDALEKQLQDLGVEIYRATKPVRMHVEEGRVCEMTCLSNNGEIVFDKIDHLFWSAGLAPFAQVAALDTSDVERPHFSKGVTVFFKLPQPPLMGRLNYFYCFDKGFDTFRVTSFASYCEAAGSDEGGYPVSVELWPEEIEEDKDYIAQAWNELVAFGVVDDSHKNVLYKHAIVSARALVPSLHNMDQVNRLRDVVQSANYKNAHCIGVFSEKDVFFFPDILRGCYQKVKAAGLI